jgi:hypothetical protein
LGTTNVTTVLRSEFAYPSELRFEGFKFSRPDDWSLVQWLPGWRLEADHGFCHVFRNQALDVALAYSDIFEAGGNPDKGGHGPGVLFRYDFGKRRALGSSPP